MVWLAFVSFLLVPVPMALGRHRTWCWRTITQAWVRSDVGSRPSRVHCIGPFYQGSPDLPWEPERLEPTKRITVGPWTRPKATNTMVSDTSVEPTFNVFLDKMAHPNAVDLVRSIKRCVRTRPMPLSRPRGRRETQGRRRVGRGATEWVRTIGTSPASFSWFERLALMRRKVSQMEDWVVGSMDAPQAIRMTERTATRSVC
mmetsp:Transcript_4944/g.31652  ORF Transcript_4944/g.31652 Transcript_4944/m.31652 type:complete len:201 (+) Transcript_4944:2479-3081(+)